MDIRRIASGFITLLAAALVLGALAPARTHAAPAVWDPVWHSAAADDGNNDIGSHSSIAFNPDDHHPYVSYYQAQTGYLKLANYTDGNGVSCGAGWDCSSLDGGSGSQTGAKSSLIFAGGGNGWIAYTDPAHATAKLIQRFGGVTLDTMVVRADQGPSDNPPGTDQIDFPSVAVWQGIPTVAFYENVNLGGNIYTMLRLMSPYGPSSDIEVINDSVTLGYYPSLDYDQLTGNPVVAYRGNGGAILPASHTLNYAQLSNAPGGCNYVNTPSAWDCRVIDYGAETGNFVSFHAPRSASDRMQVAYYDGTKHQLKYARRVGGDVYCNSFPLADAGWQCDAIETIDIGGFGVGLSMAVDDNNNPVIAYYSQTDYATGVLKVARYVGSGGNCGIGGAFGSWQCVLADRGLVPLVGVHDVGQNPSIALSPDGRVYVSHYDASAKQLRVTNEKGLAPTLTKSYNKSTVKVGDLVQATYVIQNNLANGAHTPMTQVNFTDDVAPTATVNKILSNNCGPIVPHKGNAGFYLSNGVVPAASYCTIKVELVAQTAGQRFDTTGILYSTEAKTIVGATSSIMITQFSKLFLPLIVR